LARGVSTPARSGSASTGRDRRPHLARALKDCGEGGRDEAPSRSSGE
jgi:hypothetical protein